MARRARNYKAVHRPTRWGNPYPVADYGLSRSLELYALWLEERLNESPEFLEPLRGHDIGCFCALDQPCHGDLILKKLYE